MWRLILKSGSLNLLEPSGPLQGLPFAFQPTQLDVMGKNKCSSFPQQRCILRPFVGHHQAIHKKKTGKEDFMQLLIIFIFVFPV